MAENLIEPVDTYVGKVIPEGKTLRAFRQLNCGKDTLITSLSITELGHYSDVSNTRKPEDQQSQRGLHLPHANDIAKYLLRALLDTAILRMRKQGRPVNDYFEKVQKELGQQIHYTIPPIVANLRNNTIDDIRPWIVNSEKIGHLITLEVGDLLWIVDGQHRRMAIEFVLDFLKYINTNYKYPRKSALYTGHKDTLSEEELAVWSECKNMCSSCKISVEVHVGLNINEERQLFYDLNSYGKAIDVSLANRYDSSNSVNVYWSEELKPGLFKQHNFVVLDSQSEADWNAEVPSITGRSLSAIHSILFLNKGNIKGAAPGDVSDYKKQIANNYWLTVFSIPGFLNQKPKLETVLAQPAVLKAVAKLYYETYFGKKPSLNNGANQEMLAAGLKTFNFGHNNPVWRYYQLSPEERANSFPGLNNYLPIDVTPKNRDMGMFDLASNTFKFGIKHNDIVPLISDILKWHCQLPSRQKKDETATVIV